MIWIFRSILDLKLPDFELKYQHECTLTAVSPKNGRKIQIIACETSKMHLLQMFLFWTLSFDYSPFLSQLTKEKVLHFFRKPWMLAVETNYKPESKYVTGGSKWVLVNSLVISKPIDLGKSYVQKKAMNSGKWKQFWNW